MGLDLGFFQRHPIITGATIIIGGIVFISLSGWGSGSGKIVTTTGASDAQAAAQTATQIAQIQAGTANAQGAYALELAKVKSAGEVSVAQMLADLEMYKTDASVAVTYAGYQAGVDQGALQLAAIREQTNAALEIARNNNDTQVQLTNIAAATDAASIAAQTDLQTQQIRVAYDTAAWNYANQQTAMRLQADYATNVLMSNERGQNQLVDLLAIQAAGST